MKILLCGLIVIAMVSGLLIALLPRDLLMQELTNRKGGG